MQVTHSSWTCVASIQIKNQNRTRAQTPPSPQATFQSYSGRLVLGKGLAKVLLPDSLREWPYTGHGPFLVCAGPGRRGGTVPVGALVILLERVRRAVALSANQRRAPRRKGKEVWSPRKRQPISQMLSLEGPVFKIWTC